jgi:arylformamidase
MLIDISQPIAPGIPTWPGDTVYRETRLWHLAPGCPVNVAKIEMSSHTGTHADAPLHYRADGAAIGAVGLGPYIGPCAVLDVSGAVDLVRPADLGPQAIAAPRVLLRTFRRTPAGWPAFAGIDPAVIGYLASCGVVLIGVDAPSIDPEASKTLDAHHAVDRHGMAILEGLVLDRAAPGRYDLVALPLPFAGLDASPVRAVLLPPGTIQSDLSTLNAL